MLKDQLQLTAVCLNVSSNVDILRNSTNSADSTVLSKIAITELGYIDYIIFVLKLYEMLLIKREIYTISVTLAAIIAVKVR